MNIKFEPAKQKDIQQLIEVQNKAFYPDYIKYGQCPGYAKSEESMLDTITHTDTFKIMVDDVVVGDIIVRKKVEHDYFLGCLCVIPEYENKGIGEKAMAFIDAYYTDVTRWSLVTPADKKRNHYFYQKCGFEITESIMDGDVQLVTFVKNVV